MLTLPWCATDSAPSADRARITAWRTRGVSTRVTGPAGGEPVTLDFAKKHSRIVITEEDQVIAFRLSAARAWLERYTGRGFMQQTWDWTISDGEITHAGPILLPVAPVLSVTSVTSYDQAGAATVMSNTLYFLDAASTPARLLLNAGATWPSGLRAHNSLVVRYVVGYGTDGLDPEKVPIEIRQAILLLAGEWHERLEAGTELDLLEAPFGVRALVDSYRVMG